jgi:hypothetical protein
MQTLLDGLEHSLTHPAQVEPHAAQNNTVEHEGHGACAAALSRPPYIKSGILKLRVNHSLRNFWD